MAILKFNVKENSINEFFKLSEREQRETCSPMGVSAYHLMKDEIYISKNLIGKEKQIEFQLSDYSRGSQKELMNTYLYEVQEYDSLKYKLKLIKFNIDTL